jgi:Uma2 family endonuclease
MAPAPNDEHRRIVDELIELVRPLLRQTGRGVLRSGINVFDEAANQESYRVPDLTFVAAHRTALMAADGIRGGGPDAVIEVRSPGAESYDKLPFCARIGTGEVIIIDRDRKVAEVFRLGDGEYHAVGPDAEGWIISEALGLRLRGAEGRRLEIEDLAPPHIKLTI